MPLSLPSMNAAIVCDGKELETYNVTQEGTSLLEAFIASEAGKQFKITFLNNLTNFELAIFVHIDGRLMKRKYLRAGSNSEFLGPHKSTASILPLKFQEIQLVDPDLEDAPVVPEMGTIELKAYRCRTRPTTRTKRPSSRRRHDKHEDPHSGRVSERSKKAGWHHIATGDEIPITPKKSHNGIDVDYLDSEKGPPYASIKIFYRPRELLRAQGIIPANDVGRQGSPINNKRKRTREDELPGPSRSHPKIKVKGEELSEDMATQRIQALQAELDSWKAAVQSGSSIKRELRSPSPIIVRHSGEVVDLTLDD